MKQIARFTAIVLATITAALAVWQFRQALILFIFSLIIAAVLRPVVDRLRAAGLPRGLALVFTYLALIAIIVGVVMTLGGPFLSELQALIIDLPKNFNQFETQWMTGNLLQQTIARNLQDFANLFRTVSPSQWNLIGQNFLGITMGSVSLFSSIAISFVLSIYWSASQEHFMRLWLSLLPAEWRTRATDIWQNIERQIGSYLRSELFQSLLTLIFLAIGYQLIGLKYPVILAFVGAISWLIIWIGGVIAVIPALLAGLAISPFTGLVAALFTIAVLIFMELFVEPKIFHSQRTSTLLVVALALIFVMQYGIFGFFIAPLLSSVIEITARQLIHPNLAPNTEATTPPVVQIDLLKERLSTIQSTMAALPESPPPEIVNLVCRLEELIERVNQEGKKPVEKGKINPQEG